MNNNFYGKVAGCKKISIQENKLKYVNGFDGEFGIDLNLIGFNEDGEILAVNRYDWEIVKITKDLKFEELGRIDRTLNEVTKNPELLLNGVKEMSIRDIEKELGYKILLKDYKND